MISSDHRQLVERDVAIPALATLFDDEAMFSLLHDHFPDQRISTIRCDSIRYTPGTNCLARYAVDTASGPRYFHAVAHAAGACEKLQKAKTVSRNGAGELRAHVCDERSLVVYPFPLDDELPALAALASPDATARLVRRIVTGSSTVSDLRVEPLSYKPRRRFVARLESDGQPLGVLRLYADQAYGRARRAAKALVGMRLQDGRVMGHSDRARAMLFDWVPGNDCEALATAADFPVAALHRAGGHLRQLHQARGDRLPTLNWATHARNLHQVEQELAWLLPDQAEEISQFLAKLTEQMQHNLAGPRTPLHGDFAPAQVIVDGDHVTFLDFDNAALGLPTEDLASFLAQLEKLVCMDLLTRRARDTMFQALCEGYDAQGNAIDPHHLRLLAAVALVRLVQEPFRRGWPRWRQPAENILDRAMRLHEKAVRTIRTPGRSPTIHVDQQPEVRPCDAVVDDPGIPWLVEAICPESASKAFNEAMAADGESPLTVVSIEVLRHKSQRRCLVQYELQSGPNAVPRFVLGKIHARGRHERSFHRQQALWDAGFSYDASDRIAVARALGIVPRWNMWLQERVPGEVCWATLTDRHGERVARRIAAEAHTLHASNVTPRATHTVHEELATLAKGLTQLASAQPHIADRLERLYACCNTAAGRLPVCQPMGIHRDFYPDQVLVDGDRLYVVDHDLYALGDPHLDIGNFCGHLIEWGVRRENNPCRYDSARLALVTRYLELNTSAEQLSIDIYTLMTVARLVYLSTQFADRSNTTLQLLEYCESQFQRLLGT